MVSVAFPNPFLRTEKERLAKYIMRPDLEWMNTEPHLSLIAMIFFFAEKEKIVFSYMESMKSSLRYMKLMIWLTHDLKTLEMGASERQQIFPHDNQHIITSKGRDSDVKDQQILKNIWKPRTITWGISLSRGRY